MSKYREQVGRLMRVNSIDRSLRLHTNDHSQVGFDRNNSLRYDTGIIQVSYGQSNIQSYGTNA